MPRPSTLPLIPPAISRVTLFERQHYHGRLTITNMGSLKGSFPRLRHTQFCTLTCSKVQARIYGHTFNPACTRTGNKVLRERLKGPAVASYYPPRSATLKEMMAFYPQLETYDEKEADRIDSIAIIKARGKGPPKKKRTAEGMFAGSLIPGLFNGTSGRFTDLCLQNRRSLRRGSPLRRRSRRLHKVPVCFACSGEESWRPIASAYPEVYTKRCFGRSHHESLDKIMTNRSCMAVIIWKGHHILRLTRYSLTTQILSNVESLWLVPFTTRQGSILLCLGSLAGLQCHWRLLQARINQASNSEHSQAADRVRCLPACPPVQRTEDQRTE